MREFKILSATAILGYGFPEKSFIEGMKCAKSDVKVPNLPKIRKKPKQTAENARLNDILSNIEAYDGTSNGQKEIK